MLVLLLWLQLISSDDTEFVSSMFKVHNMRINSAVGIYLILYKIIY